MPNLRPLLPEFEFIINIPGEIIDQININEVEELIKVDKKPVGLCKYQLSSPPQNVKEMFGNCLA